ELSRIQTFPLQPAAQMRQHIGVVLSRPRREPLTDQLLPERIHPLGQRPTRAYRIPTLRHHDMRLLREAPMKAQSRPEVIPPDHPPTSSMTSPYPGRPGITSHPG